MTTAFSDINWVGVAIATIAAAALGGLYFGALVSQRYLRVLGRTEAPAPTALAAVGPVVCLFLVVLASAVLVAAADLTSVGDALTFGLVVGVGFLVAMTFQIAINPNFPRPVAYGLLNAPYFLTVGVVSSLVLVLV